MQPDRQIDDLVRRWGQLKTERSTWMPHWQEISKVLIPRSGRFFVSDRNRGGKRHNDIYDNAGTRALRILGAGLMGGMTSPARPWFRLATPDRELNKHPNVRRWLAEVTQLMLDVFAKSNTYRALHQGYEELGAFGTFSAIVVPDFKTVIHHHPLTCGEYALAANWRRDVDTMFREFQMPVGSLVKEFGLDACSRHVRDQFRRGEMDGWITVIHAVEPMADRAENAKGDGWRSTYFELGGDTGLRLREATLPASSLLAARWTTMGGDVYGSSPAMDALGDVRQLQHQQLRKAQAIDFMVNPPLAVPSGLKNREVDRLPGGITYVDMGAGTSPVQSMWDVRLDLSHMLVDMQDVRDRIRSAFYSDLFMMISQDDGKMTAYEVARRNEEKLMMLGPVLERLHNELLDPLVEMTFSTMVQAGVVPPAPEEMQGVELNVEFVSMLAQAQRAVQTAAVDRYVATLGQIAAFKPEIVDKFDSDRWADEYADMLGVDPRMVVAGDQVAIVRQARAQAQAAAQQAAVAEQVASAAQKLGGVPMGPGADNAGARAIEMFSGY